MAQGGSEPIKRSRRVLGIAIAATAAVLPALTVLSTPSVAGGENVALVAEQFAKSSLTVLPGTQVSLHWAPPFDAPATAGAYFLVGSTLPGFATGSGLTWPSQSTTTADPSSSQWAWDTTATALTVTIPAGATPGTSYQVDLETCAATTCLDSSTSQTELDIPANPTEWTTSSYSLSDFQTAQAIPIRTGQALETTVDEQGDAWTSSEFSNDLVETKASVATSTPFVDSSNVDPRSKTYKPFRSCTHASVPCLRSSRSALSEAVTDATGRVWFTFGGDFGYTGERPNRSEIVSFDPSTSSFCTYLVPGTNNEVTGIAYANGYIWFTESIGTSGTGSLGGFDPVQNQCSGTDSTYALPGSVQLMTWPSTPWDGDVWPAEVTADPSGTDLWVTDFLGYAGDADQLCQQISSASSCGEIDEVNVSDPLDPQIAEQYVFPSSNVFALGGAEPWGVVADSTYVYAIDYGDSNLVRIDKSSGQVDEVPLPLTSDDEDGYGLALYSDRLYFTLSDDSRPAFGGASTVGYIDLASWSPGSQPTTGVVYEGISSEVDHRADSDFRGIAADACGDLVITDLHQEVRLMSKSQTGPCPS